MEYLGIRILGDPVLREKASPVERIDKNIKKLISKLLTAMKKVNGIGLSAPQVGHLLRVITVDVGEGPLVLINPVIIDMGKEKEQFEEG